MAQPRRDRRGRFLSDPRAKADDAAWKALLKQVRESDKMRVHVGVIASKGGNEEHADEGGVTLIELAVIHELGSPAANIPERSFIRRTFEQKRDQIGTVCEKAARALLGGMPPKRALDLVGLFASTEIKKTVTEGEHIPPPLAPATIARKGSDRPLIDTGRLINAVSWEVVDTRTGDPI